MAHAIMVVGVMDQQDARGTCAQGVTGKGGIRKQRAHLDLARTDLGHLHSLTPVVWESWTRVELVQNPWNRGGRKH